MNLVISASLVNKPHEISCVRYLTLAASGYLQLSCLVEAEKESKDIYYNFMKRKGLLDFIEQFVTPEEQECGIGINTIWSYDRTLKVQSIDFNTLFSVIGKVEMLSLKP